MDRDESVALFLQGREAWNAWAEKMLAERKSMEADGRWSAEQDIFGDLRPQNEQTRSWLSSAMSDFSRCLFLALGAGETNLTKKPLGEVNEAKRPSQAPIKLIQLKVSHIDFEGFIFPGDALFDSATFMGDAWFHSADFKGYARFASAAFAGAARFDRAVFRSDALFDVAAFKNYARFAGATFARDAQFDSAAFTGDASFDSAAFIGHARFTSAVFSRDAWLQKAAFSGYASFNSARFCGNAGFQGAIFRRGAIFRAIVSQRAFSLIGVRFQWKAPDFLSAKFAEPVWLDNVRLESGVEPGGLLRSIFAGWFLWILGRLDPEMSTKYRAFKRLAIQSEDHRNEQIFFRGELRARRYAEDWPWHPGFWFGILYELASDFGHSISRPILWLIALSLLSSWFYLGQGVQADVSPRAHIEDRLLAYLPDRIQARVPALQPEALTTLACKDGSAGDPVAAAALLSVRQSSVFGAFDSTKSTQIYACLYGFDANVKPALAVPDAVVLWGIGQTAVSAALLFLFLLALRNQFKIK